MNLVPMCQGETNYKCTAVLAACKRANLRNFRTRPPVPINLLDRLYVRSEVQAAVEDGLRHRQWIRTSTTREVWVKVPRRRTSESPR